MLEILALLALTKRIGKMVEQKGHKSGWYKALTVGLWFGGEIVGLMIGTILTGGDPSAQYLPYLIALVGAVSGASIAYAIATNISSIPPNSLSAPSSTEMGS